ncbi:MAG: acyltransferase, partial [Candidatus Electrothrix sp. AUS1_2]|nr:acyltransferase [Candidatus Electrothrix sp. AUS1_2]
MLFHLGLGGFQNGFLGVDVFFVVSGYLMAVLYDPDKKKNFFSRRALRLLPAYFVVTLLVIIVSTFTVTPNESKQVLEQSVYASLFASNIGFLLQDSYFSKSQFSPLLHLWSLGVEIQFFLVIPILVYFFQKHSSFLWLIALSSLGACFVIVELSPNASFFMMPMRLWEFLIGYGAAKYFSVDGNIQTATKKQFIGSIFFFVILSIPIFKVDGQAFSILTGHPGIHALLITVSTGFVLACGLPKQLENSYIGSLLEVIGNYSYSIYLVHFPAIV